MAVSIFKGTVPVEDWSGFEQSVNRAVNKYEDLGRQREAQEEAERKEAEAKYLAQAKVDPIYTASSYWQKEQGKQIQDFQKKLGQIYFRSKNKPTIEDQIEIQNNKQALFNWQQKLKSDQQKYKSAVKEVQKDPTGRKYDLDHFKKRIQEWIDPKGEGKLSDDLLLPPLIPDLKTYFASKNYSLTKLKQTTDRAGKRITTEVPMNEDEARGKAVEDMYKDPSVYRTVTESFSTLPKGEKEKYLSKYGPDESYKAITDYMYDNFGKYAFKAGDVSIGPAPKGRERSTTQIEGSVNFDNPSDKITISIGKITGAKGLKEDVPADVDVWGGYSLPGSISGVATARQYYDMYSGKMQDVPIGEDIVIKYPEIKYLPIGRNGDIAGAHTGYRDENGSLRPGYKIKAVLITRTDQGESKGLELTPELKNKLKTKNPRLADQIEKIPLEVKPKGVEKPKEKEPETNKILTKADVPAGAVLKRNKKTGELMWFDANDNKLGYGK